MTTQAGPNWRVLGLVAGILVLLALGMAAALNWWQGTAEPVVTYDPGVLENQLGSLAKLKVPQGLPWHSSGVSSYSSSSGGSNGAQFTVSVPFTIERMGNGKPSAVADDKLLRQVFSSQLNNIESTIDFDKLHITEKGPDAGIAEKTPAGQPRLKWFLHSEEVDMEFSVEQTGQGEFQWQCKYIMKVGNSFWGRLF